MLAVTKEAFWDFQRGVMCAEGYRLKPNYEVIQLYFYRVE